MTIIWICLIPILLQIRLSFKKKKRKVISQELTLLGLASQCHISRLVLFIATRYPAGNIKIWTNSYQIRPVGQGQTDMSLVIQNFLLFFKLRQYILIYDNIHCIVLLSYDDINPFRDKYFKPAATIGPCHSMDKLSLVRVKKLPKIRHFAHMIFSNRTLKASIQLETDVPHATWAVALER